MKKKCLVDNYDYLQYIGELEPIKASRGSYLGREYKPNVYSITDPSSDMKKVCLIISKC